MRTTVLAALTAAYRGLADVWYVLLGWIHDLTVTLVILALAIFMIAACSGSSDGADPVTTAVLEAEPEADRSDIAVDIEIIKDQVPDATDEQIAGWIIEVIQWNICLEQHPTGTGCTEISPDNPRNW
jgi:hypothetical protein